VISWFQDSVPGGHSELLHAEIESCPVQSQTCRCTPWAGENPARLSEGRDYVLPLDLFQSLAPLMFVPRRNTGMKVLDRDPQTLGRERESPRVRLHSPVRECFPPRYCVRASMVRRDRIDRFVHLPRGVLDENAARAVGYLPDVRATVEWRWGKRSDDSKRSLRNCFSTNHPFQVADGSQLPPERRLSASACCPNARIPAPAKGAGVLVGALRDISDFV